MSISWTTCHYISCASSKWLILITVHSLHNLIVCNAGHLRLSLVHVSFAESHKLHGLLWLLRVSRCQESSLASVILAASRSTRASRTSTRRCPHHLLLGACICGWLPPILLSLHVVILTAAGERL